MMELEKVGSWQGGEAQTEKPLAAPTLEKIGTWKESRAQSPETKPAYMAPEVERAVIETGDLDTAMRASQGNLEWALKLTHGVNPDTAARVKTISQAIRAPKDTVQRNLGTAEELAQAQSVIRSLTERNEKGDYKYPYTLGYLSDPERMSLAKDDVQALAALEDKIARNKKEADGFIARSGNAFMSGLASMDAAIMKAPGLVYDIFAMPQNFVAEKFDIPSLKTDSTAIGLRDNFLARYYDNAEKYYRPIQLEEDSIEQLKQGEIAKAAENIYLQAISNAPNLLMLAATSGAGAAIPLTTAGAIEASSSYDAARDRGKDIVPAIQGALLRGAAEGIFEKYTFDLFKNFGRQLSGTVGKQAAKEVMKQVAVNAGKAFYGEGQSELLTSYAQDFSDYITGDKEAMEGSTARAINAFFVGGVTGFGLSGMSSVTEIAAKNAEYQRQSKALAEQEQAAMQSKLKQRDKATFEDFIDKASEAAGVKDLFVSPDALQSLAQTKDPNAVKQALADLGVTPEAVKDAETTGADIAIPRSKWLSTVAETDIGQALRPDIRFSPDGLTEREHARSREDLARTVQDMQTEYNTLIQNEKMPEKLKGLREVMLATPEQGGLGMASEDADAQLSVLLAGAKVLSKKTGETVDEWFDRVNPRIKAEQFDGFPEDTETRVRPTRDETGAIMAPGGYPQFMDDKPKRRTELRMELLTPPAVAETAAIAAAPDAPVEMVGGYRKDVMEALRATVSNFDYESRKIIPAGMEERTNEPIIVPARSTYPDWFRDLGYTKKQALAIIDKFLAGKKLTEKQAETLAIMYEQEKTVFESMLFQSDSPVQSAATFVVELGDFLNSAEGNFSVKQAYSTESFYLNMEGKEYRVSAHSKKGNSGVLFYDEKELSQQVASLSSALRENGNSDVADQVEKRFAEYVSKREQYKASGAKSASTRAANETAKRNTVLRLFLANDAEFITSLRESGAYKKDGGLKSNIGGYIQKAAGVKGVKITKESALTLAKQMLSAPSGSQEQDQTKTEAFKKWFGNSKFVDENGKPKVYYHGSPSGEFDVFNTEGAGKTAGTGAFFTDNESVAKTYAGEKGKVFAVYLKGENPSEVDWRGRNWNAGFEDATVTGNEEDGFYVNAVLNGDVDAELAGPFKTEAEAEREAEKLRAAATGFGSTDDAARLARESGNDSIRISNAVDEGPRGAGSKVPSEVVVVFDPTQIKSATGNSGAFNPRDPSILFQSAFHGTPHDFDKFQLNKIGTGEGAQAYGWGLYFAQSRDVAEWYRKNLAETRVFEYEGRPYTREEFFDFVEKELEGVSSDARQMTSNFFYYLASNIFEDAADMASKGEDPAAIEKLKYIVQGLSRQGTPTQRKIAPKLPKGMRDYNAMTHEERMGFFELQGRLQWFNTEKVKPEDALKEVKGDLKTSVANLLSRLENPAGMSESDITKDRRTLGEYIAALEVLDKYGVTAKVEKAPGQLFEVEIPESEDMLDWDKPLAEQSLKVKEALNRIDPRIVEAINKGYHPSFENPLGYDPAKFDKLTGRQIYEGIQNYAREALDVMPEGASLPEQASKYLLSLGIPGLKYLDGSSRSQGTGAHNFVIFDDSLVEIKNKFYQKRDNTPKGSIQFTTAGAIIRLYKNADLSTMLHESAHLFMREIEQMVAYGQADTQLREDYETLLDFAGGKLDRAGEEKIARAFEAYLREGKAPSAKLTEAFRRFRAWLTAIYRSIRGLEEVTPEIKGVFDRLLASEDEIQDAERYYRAKTSLADMLAADEAKKTEVKTKRQKANQSSVDKQVSKYMRAYLKAIGGKKQVRDLAEREVDSNPVYAALTDSRGPKYRNKGVDIQGIRAIYGDAVAEGIKKNHPDAVTEEGSGVSAAELAVDYGFESDAAFVEALQNATPKKDAVSKRTDEILKEREADIRKEIGAEESTPGEESYHTEDRLTYLIAEADLLAAKLENAKEAKDRKLEAKVFRDTALEAVNAKPVRLATRYDLYSKAEARYAKQAFDLASDGKFAEAHEAKKRQILNHEMVRASVEARELRADIEDRYGAKKLKKKLESTENSYANIVLDLVSAYGLTPNIAPPKNVQNLYDLDEVLAGLVPSWIMKKENTGDYRDLTMTQLRELDDAIQSIIHYGRDELASMKDTEYKTITDFVEASVGTMIPLRDKAVYNEFSLKGRIMNKIDGLLSRTALMEFVFERLDNYSFTKTKAFGPLRKLFNRGIQAEADFAAIRKKAYDAAAPHWETLYQAKKRLDARFGGTAYNIDFLPTTGGMRKVGRFQWTAERLVALALNLGNEGNANAVKNAFGFTDEQLQGVLGLFNDAELNAIQGIWDATNELFPQLDQTHFGIYNRRLAKVEPKPVVIQRSKEVDGQTVDDSLVLRGGYYPLVFDHMLNDQAAKYAEEDLMKNQSSAVFRKTKPEDGFTFSRVPGHSLPPDLSLGVWFKHISETARYISHAEYMRDLNRVTLTPEWRDMVRDKAGREIYEQMRDWVKYQANPERRLNNPWERHLESQRQLATAAILGLGFATGVKQRLAIFNTAQEIGLKAILDGYRHTDLATSVLGLQTKEGTWNKVLDMSPYLATRAGNIDRELRDALSKMDPMTKRFEIAGKEFTWKDVKEFMFEWINMNDRAIIAPAWLGAYNKRMSENEAVGDMEARSAEAVTYADAIIRSTQASSLPIELNSLQRSEGVLRLFTSFMTWSFKWGGRLTTYVRAYKDGAISTKDYARHIMYEHLFQAWGNIAISTLVLSGELPEWWEWLVSPIDNAISWLPIVREIPGAFKYRKSIGVSPAFEGYQRIAKAGKTTWEWIEDDKEFYQVLWDIGRVVEFQAGVPALKAVKSVKDTYANITGESKK